jgi:hypothetical protein
MVLSQAPVAHACNPSYSGGRDQEDQGLKPACANSSQDSISKMPNTKKAGRVAQVSGKCEALSSNHSTANKQTKPLVLERKKDTQNEAFFLHHCGLNSSLQGSSSAT